MSDLSVSSEARSLIRDQLNTLAREQNIRILLAVESGSRAWGFHSKDSDYDVRYIYARDPSAYCAVFPGRDVIEGPSDAVYDFSGWDISKALGLMYKSNPCLYEWLSSPIRYAEGNWGWQLKSLSKDFFRAVPAMHHYLSMARHNYREHMRNGVSPTVRLKKYLYICRPLLCCRWIEREVKPIPPPMRYLDLLNADLTLDNEVRFQLAYLMRRKQEGDELAEGQAVPAINAFIDAELARLPGVAVWIPRPDARPDLDGPRLNRFLFDCVHAPSSARAGA